MHMNDDSQCVFVTEFIVLKRLLGFTSEKIQSPYHVLRALVRSYEGHRCPSLLYSKPAVHATYKVKLLEDLLQSDTALEEDSGAWFDL